MSGIYIIRHGKPEKEAYIGGKRAISYEGVKEIFYEFSRKLYDDIKKGIKKIIIYVSPNSRTKITAKLLKESLRYLMLIEDNKYNPIDIKLNYLDDSDPFSNKIIEEYLKELGRKLGYSSINEMVENVDKILERWYNSEKEKFNSFAEELYKYVEEMIEKHNQDKEVVLILTHLPQLYAMKKYINPQENRIPNPLEGIKVKKDKKGKIYVEEIYYNY